MLPFMQLFKFRGGSRKSHSLVIDFNQRYVRNLFLFGFGMCLARQLFGPNIVCLLPSKTLDQTYVDTKCFINGTMTITSDHVLHHNYYQWVSVVLLLMAFTFHFPFAVWSRRYEYFLASLETNIKDDKACEHIRHVVIESNGDYLFWKTRVLEMIYAVHLGLHVLLLDMFFNRAWSEAGWSWSVIPKLFPETGSCHFNFYDAGGENTQKVTCLLPLSIVFRKIFYVLYGIVVVSITLHVVSFLYHISLLIRLGRKNVDIFWCLYVAKKNAETWEARKKLEEIWNIWYMPPKYKVDIQDTYVSMNKLSKGPLSAES